MNMLKLKTSELEGMQLDWAVAMAAKREIVTEGIEPGYVFIYEDGEYIRYEPSSDYWRNMGKRIRLLARRR